jgi:hypothetical protein
MSPVRFRRPTAIEAAAAGFLALAVGATAVWFVTDAADEWMVNIATSAATVAVTITIVERLFDREEKRRRAPLVERALGYIEFEFIHFANTVAFDYATIHRDRPMPRRSLELLDRWLADLDDADAPHIVLPPDDKTLRQVGFEFADLIAPHASHEEMLEPRVILAIRDFSTTARMQRSRLRVLTLGPPKLVADGIERQSYRSIVQHVRELMGIIRDEGRGEYVLDDETLAQADELRAARFDTEQGI